MSSVKSPTTGGTAAMLPAERARASFDPAKLYEVMGGAGGSQRELVEQFQPLFSDPIFDASLDDYKSYKELFETKQARAAKAMQIVRNNPKFMMAHMGQKVAMGDFFETGALGIHFRAYLPFLQTNASAEQKAEWLDGAINAKYFAAYAQSELGHGSNLRALETTATYDIDADEFVIHSPTLTSMKWWPTAIYQCTHAVVFAQLIVSGRNHGVFGFFVQLRDPEGNCMPGIEVGEMGPKVAANDTGIGYARFDHVRVPRFNMFAKTAQVTRDGEFVAAPPKLSKFGYVGMMTIRVVLVQIAGTFLSQAATSAIRYSCVREQGFKDTKSDDPIAGGEHVILDYKIQQYRLFRALGLSILFFWTGRVISDFLKRVVSGVGQGDEKAMDDLPELHATCAGLKAVCTSWGHVAMEDCRKACGGQGYLRSSGVGDIAVGYAGLVTAEGEQMILGLQTARYLIKMVGEVKANKASSLPTAMQYLGSAQMEPLNGDTFRGKTSVLLALMRDRARRVAFDLHSDFTESINGGMDFDDALNSVAVLGYHACECHCMAVMAANMAEALDDATYIKDPAVKAVLTKFFELTVLIQIRESGIDFCDVLSGAQVRRVLKSINELLTEIRPEAIAVVDGIGITDSQMHSTIGRYDGNVYEAIYEEARLNPLNIPKMVGWDHLAPMLDLEFMKKGLEWQRQGAKVSSKL